MLEALGQRLRQATRSGASNLRLPGIALTPADKNNHSQRNAPDVRGGREPVAKQESQNLFLRNVMNVFTRIRCVN